jgi:hypothetical protein
MNVVWLSLPPATNPCPAWCQDDPFHSYAEECPDAPGVVTRLTRSHKIKIGTATSSAWLGHWRPRAQYEVTVTVLVLEEAEPDETGVTLGKPYVHVDGEVAEQSVEEAEAFAEIMARAAATARAIEASR